MVNAGAVFAGPYAPVSLGDYLAGSNHVLRPAAPRGMRRPVRLAVRRLVNVIECDKTALAAAAPLIDALGGAEDLAAHVEAVRARVHGKAGPSKWPVNHCPFGMT